ncbi:MAG: DUF692 domain-containing protein, partial [Robiginitomaculum sp.]
HALGYSGANSHKDSGHDIWYEVHPENYMVDGGPRLSWLEEFSNNYPISFHGIGASLGGLDPFCDRHLKNLKALIDRFNPAQVSEHATWSSFEGEYFADLLPLPRTRAAEDHMVERIDAFQSAIGRRILIENPTNYMRANTDLGEPEFLSQIAKRAGCGLLMDVNNIYISAVNTGIDARAYIKAIAPDLVGEIHIAGHHADKAAGAALLIDTHSAPVADPVWELLEFALAHLGPKPVLLERDGEIPSFETLLGEHERASQCLARASENVQAPC